MKILTTFIVLLFAAVIEAQEAPATLLIEKRSMPRVVDDLRRILNGSDVLPSRLSIVSFDASDVMAARGKVIEFEAAKKEFFRSVTAANIKTAIDEALTVTTPATTPRCVTIEDSLARTVRTRSVVLLIVDCPGLCRRPTKPLGSGKGIFVVVPSTANGGNQRRLLEQREGLVHAFLPEATVFAEFELEEAVRQFLLASSSRR
jgi:hypothetical protein